MAILKVREDFWRQQNQRALARSVESLYRGLHDLGMWWGEDIVHQFTPDGLAVWVGVRSWRPKQLLDKIQQAAFKAFEMPGVRFDGDRHWTLFRIAFN
jgi:hypothetical protein